MNGARCPSFGLHLDDAWNGSPEVFPAITRPLIAEFTHRGSGRDGINRNHFARAVRNGRDGFVGINRGLLSAHEGVSRVVGASFGRTNCAAAQGLRRRE